MRSLVLAAVAPLLIGHDVQKVIERFLNEKVLRKTD